MAYNEVLAERIRSLLARRRGMDERKMFGGVAFLLNGNMCCGVLKNDLIVRVGPDRYEDAITLPHARPMDFTGRPIKGFVYVGPMGCRTGAALAKWIRMGIELASSLPKKRKRR